jgi:hypothetical protein
MKGDKTISSSTSSEAAIETPIWHHAVAGGVSGAGARIVTAPLDLLKIRRQLNARNKAAIAALPPGIGKRAAIPSAQSTSVRGIYKSEGFKGVSKTPSCIPLQFLSPFILLFYSLVELLTFRLSHTISFIVSPFPLFLSSLKATSPQPISGSRTQPSNLLFTPFSKLTYQTTLNYLPQWLHSSPVHPLAFSQRSLLIPLTFAAHPSQRK